VLLYKVLLPDYKYAGCKPQAASCKQIQLKALGFCCRDGVQLEACGLRL